MAQRVGIDADTRQELKLPTGLGFPDIWREILGYFTDAADFQNLLLASPDYFEPLLEDRKSAFLFPLALKVLDRRDYVAKSTTLECRLVSKIAKSSIDKLIREGNPCLENLDGWDHDTWDPKHNIYHCWSPSGLTRWKNLLGNVNPKFNPFVGGHVAFYTQRSDEPRILDHFRSLLAHFGNLIRHFTLYASGPSNEGLELLRECLEGMPNLRTLDLYDGTRIREGDSQRFLASSLPNLTSLSTLKIGACPSIHLVSVVLEKYGAQVQKRNIRCVPRDTFNHLPLGLGFAYNLQHVSLTIIWQVDEVLVYLNPMREWPPTLETLSVKTEAGPLELISDFFAALENCFRTSRNLRNLNIHLMKPVSRSSYIVPPLQFFLPSLKRLWIHCEGCILQSIHFILGMRETLEEFTLDMRLSQPDESSLPQEDSHFAKLLNHMYDPNLWKEMSRLELITIRRRRRAALLVHMFSGPQKLQITDESAKLNGSCFLNKSIKLQKMSWDVGVVDNESN